MDKLTLTKIIDAFGVASKDETRPALSCVKLSPIGETQVKVTACDGTMLSEYLATDQELCNAMVNASKFRGIDDASPWFIARDALPILKLINKERIIPCVDNVGNVEIGYPTGIQLKLKTAKDLCFDKYPDVDSIYPKESETIEIGLNADLLQAVASALNESKKTNGIKIQIRKSGDTYSPIVVLNGDSRGLVMPMRA